MGETSLIDKVDELARELSGAFPASVGDDIAAISRRLREPLRLAVAGRIKAGKSTLVNALLRQRVAATDVSECTKLVTWYRHGDPQRVEIVLREGGSEEIPLQADGALPDELPVETERIASLQVYLQNDALRRMTVIDTPGLGSLNEDTSASSEELLRMGRASYAAADAADAIAFVLNRSVKEDELTIIRDWAEAGASTNGRPVATAANGVGLLTRVDTIAGDADPWQAATELAQRHTRRLGGALATVVPVMGLLAETARTGALTEPDAWHLQRLASIEPRERERMLWDARRFVDPELDLDVPAEARRRLLACLGLHGIRYALELIDSGASGAFELTGQLLRISGIDRVQDTIEACFLGARDDPLRARSALDTLERLTYRVEEPVDRGVVRRVRSRIEQLRFEEPEMHEVAELEALHAVLAGEVELPSELREDLERMAQSRGARSRMGADERAELLHGHARWRKFAVTEATPRQQRIAQVVIRAYTRAFARSSSA